MIGSRANRTYLAIEGCLLILGVCLVLNLRLTSNVSPIVAPTPALDSALTGKTNEVRPQSPPPALDSLQNYRDRPLFSATRRPPPPPEPAATPAPVAAVLPPPLHVELVGVVGPPDKRIALLRAQGAADLMRVVVGDLVGGWQVMEVGDDNLTLQQGGQHQVVTFPKLGSGDKP